MNNFAIRVLNFWFWNNRWKNIDQSPTKSASIDPLDASRWFDTSKEFDQEIRDKFEDDLKRLINDQIDLKHLEHILACIIAFDQFPRNIYRGDARAYAYDIKAKELSEYLIVHQLDRQLPYLERIFVYLPFEHSENLDDQNRSVDYTRNLYDEAKNDANIDENTLGFLKSVSQYAEQHREIIQRFGRFPHRNFVLNREMSDNEKLYLSQGGERFGQ